MQVVERTHHIEMTMHGKGLEDVKIALLKTFPSMVFYSDDEDYESISESDWFKDIKENINPGDILTIRRENKGLTQKQLSELTGIAVPNISLMEANKRSIGKSTAIKLSKALGCDANDFQKPY